MDAEVESQYDKNNPFLAKLTEYSPLYKEGSSKDTRHFVVDLTGSNLVYTCEIPWECTLPIKVRMSILS